MYHLVWRNAFDAAHLFASVTGRRWRVRFDVDHWEVSEVGT